MIDLDKWAALPLLPTAEMVRTAAKLVRANLPAHTGTLAIYSEMLAARPTDANVPALIDPARLRELERDAARYRGLRNMVACGNENVELEFDGQVDKALQEQPR